MEKVKFCTCNDLKCPFHPSNHDQGCTPCIAKNLKNHEIPDCFFKAIDRDGGVESDYTFLEFSKKVMKDR